MLEKEEREKYIKQINNYRRRLGEMMVANNMHSDKEIVKLSQKLDEIIIAYYKIKDKVKE